jgi:autoinducer 2-degrading protein
VLVVLVHLVLTPAHRDAFLTHLIANAQGSLAGEPGTLRFEIIEDAADPNCIYVVEGYRDRAAYEAHLHGEHIDRFFKAYAPHEEGDGRFRFREATTGETAGFLRMWRGTSVFPTTSEG